MRSSKITIFESTFTTNGYKVRVTGAKGRAPSDKYKTSLTFFDGHKISMGLSFIGVESAEKAACYAEAVRLRVAARFEKHDIHPFDEFCVQRLGAGDCAGSGDAEVVLKISAKHSDKKALSALAKEIVALGLATPAGMTLMSPGLPKPCPVVRLFSCLTPKSEVDIHVIVDDHEVPFVNVTSPRDAGQGILETERPPNGRFGPDDEKKQVALIELAFARSGDKGDKANIGVIARRPEYLPWITASLTEERVGQLFQKFEPTRVERFFLRGINGLNFLLHDVLGGGGVASLRHDPQGKTYAQLLLMAPIEIPRILDLNER